MEFIDSLPFTLADVAIVLLILLSGFLAYFRGLITEALAVAGWVGAAIVAAIFHGEAKALATRYLSEFVPFQLVLDLGAIAVLFVLALIVFSLILRGVAHLVRGREAGPLDRLLGFVYGLARGLVLLAVLWLGATAIFPVSSFPAAVREAKTLPLFEAAGDFLLRFAPSDLRGTEDTLQETHLRKPKRITVHDTAMTTLYKGEARAHAATKGT